LNYKIAILQKTIKVQVDLGSDNEEPAGITRSPNRLQLLQSHKARQYHEQLTNANQWESWGKKLFLENIFFNQNSF
jgi:hypothetical protein